MNLYTESRAIALEALTECGGDFDAARDFIGDSCYNHEVSIYYGKAIEFCSTQNTDAGEQFLEECNWIARAGDSFGAIACRIAHATLYCACMEALQEMESESENAVA